MNIAIGIDVGISTTKIVGIRDGKVISPLRIKANDPITSLYGAFGKYLYDNKIELSQIDKVMLTGVGAAESRLERMIVVSMGTGTSLVSCDGDEIRHIGGVGIGGGTLSGLSRLLLKTDDIHQIAALAAGGDISHINLHIGDISARPLPGLPLDATASLFANAQANAPREDIALGLVWMVLQTVGSASILSSLGRGIRDFVLIGNLTLLPQCKVVFPAMEKIYGVRFIIPEYSEFCTAIGAALLRDER